MIGDGRPHLAALIVLEPPQLATDTSAQARVADAIAQVNAARDPREQIESHAILPDPWLPGEELTETTQAAAPADSRKALPNGRAALQHLAA